MFRRDPSIFREQLVKQKATNHHQIINLLPKPSQTKCYHHRCHHQKKNHLSLISNRLFEENYANAEEVKSGLTLEVSAKEQLFMYLSWLIKWVYSVTCIFFFKLQKPLFQNILLLVKTFYIFLLAWHLFGLHVNKLMKRFQQYLTCLSTWCILDSTKRYCQQPSFLSTQSSLYSHDM